MLVLHSLCRTAGSSRVHKTESVLVIGHTWSLFRTIKCEIILKCQFVEAS